MLGDCGLYILMALIIIILGALAIFTFYRKSRGNFDDKVMKMKSPATVAFVNPILVEELIE